MEALKSHARRTVGWLAVLGWFGAGCGRVDFDTRTGDATGGGSAADAFPANCLGTGTFSGVKPVTGIADGNVQYGTFISPDGLTLLYDEMTSGSSRLYWTTRPDRGAEFPAGTLVPGLGTTGNDSDPTLSDDGLELFFMSDRGSGLCIWSATRTTTNAAFDPAVRQTQLCTESGGPNLSANGLTLAYNSISDPNNEGDLYLSVRSDRATPFPAGAMLQGLPAGVGYPALSQDRLRIWFEHETNPGLEILSGVRISPSDDFAQIKPVAELNTLGNNADVSLTADEAEVFFASDRGGTYDVWHASRPCL